MVTLPVPWPALRRATVRPVWWSHEDRAIARSAQIDSKDCPNQTWTRVQFAVPFKFEQLSLGFNRSRYRACVRRGDGR